MVTRSLPGATGTRCPILPAPHRPDPGTWRNDRITVAWLGHATVLINLFGRWILTDPALRNRIGVYMGVGTVGPRRLTQPALRTRELPRLDLLMISHAHMDHLDQGTLRRIDAETPVVASRGTADLLTRFTTVAELSWGERALIGDLGVESIPARHWGARMITDKNRGYGGFLLDHGEHRILFAGDTAYTDSYKDIGEERPVDLAIVPIGAYDPWIANHASPEQAWAMSRDMRAKYVLPVHHSTFRLSREPTDEPIRRFAAAAGAESWRIIATEIGATWSLG